MTNYNERLDEAVPTIQEEQAIREIVEYQCKALVDEGYDFEPLIQAFAGHQKQEIAKARAKQALTSLIKELVAEAKPNDFSNAAMTTDETNWYGAGYNHAIDQFEQNLLKALEEV